MGNPAEFTHAAFPRFLREHRLMGVRSAGSNTCFIPPRPLAPGQRRCDMEWVQLNGIGTLEAFSIISIGTTAMTQEGYGRDNPYCAGVIRLTEGPVITAQILGVDVRHPETIRIGSRVTVEFVDRGDGDQRRTRLAFRVEEPPKPPHGSSQSRTV
jgi:uncharacterized OB-fold protein